MRVGSLERWHQRQIEVPVTMSRHNRQDDRAYRHFALICIDRDGILRHETSPSIARSREAILSPQVNHEFLRAVARSGEVVPSHSQRKAHTPSAVDVVG